MLSKCHFIGIGGIGMSGLAQILIDKHSLVSGSDIGMSERIGALKFSGASIALGHSPENIPEGSSVVYTSMVDESNPEMRCAKERGLSLLHRSDLLKLLMHDFKPLLVTGTHGKTTTSALLAWVLLHAGIDPSYAVGGILGNTLTNAKNGKGSYFVAEADESDGTFLKYDYFGAIVTNIDLDHLDYFKDENHLLQAFENFLKKSGSAKHLFYCSDDIRLKNLFPKGVGYGFEEGALLKASDFRQNDWKILFNVHFHDDYFKDIELPMVGYHNALNALAVMGLCLNLGIEETVIRSAFATFKGVKRRAELVGECKEVLFLDDYAHHPTEIKATIKGIREALAFRRLIILFQPHRYSRTQQCLGQFKHVFDLADQVIVTDIYGASEQAVDGLSAASVVAEIQNFSSISCTYLERSRLAQEVSKHIQPFDVVVTMGAGDITKVSTEILLHLQKHPFGPLKVGIVFGGKSLEHEVSLTSARGIVEGFVKDLFEVQLFAISKSGNWIGGEEAKRILAGGKTPEPPASKNALTAEVLKQLQECQFIFPATHGTLGEDGTLQGLFEILGIKYAGCGVESSAICMNKAFLKKVAAYHGLPVVPFVDFNKFAWNREQKKILDEIFEKLEFPLIVKPVHLGSTFGISKASNLEELTKAIHEAFKLDSVLIVEKYLIGMREVEFALFGNGPYKVFPPGEILSNGQMYDYEGKYSLEGTVVSAQASLSKELIEMGMSLAKRSYEVANCNGFARVDFFLDSDEKFYLNEINPIPGFTKNSLYPRICEKGGFPLEALIKVLVSIGLKK